jgi:hypothetical protein
MQMGLSIPFENTTRRSRQDTGYALFRLAYWATVLSAARKRRTPRKVSMDLFTAPGRKDGGRRLAASGSTDSIPLH